MVICVFPFFPKNVLSVLRVSFVVCIALVSGFFTMLMILAMLQRARCVYTASLSTPDLICSWCRIELLTSNSAKTFLGFFLVLFSSHQGSISSIGFQEFRFSSARRQRSCTYTLRAVVAKGNIPCPPQLSKDCLARI